MSRPGETKLMSRPEGRAKSTEPWRGIAVGPTAAAARRSIEGAIYSPQQHSYRREE
jgi:hypothetical protein